MNADGAGGAFDEPGDDLRQELLSLSAAGPRLELVGVDKFGGALRASRLLRRDLLLMSEAINVVRAESLIARAGDVHRLEEPSRDPIADRVLVDTDPARGIAEPSVA